MSNTPALPRDIPRLDIPTHTESGDNDPSPFEVNPPFRADQEPLPVEPEDRIPSRLLELRDVFQARVNARPVCTVAAALIAGVLLGVLSRK